MGHAFRAAVRTVGWFVDRRPPALLRIGRHIYARVGDAPGSSAVYMPKDNPWRSEEEWGERSEAALCLMDHETFDWLLVYLRAGEDETAQVNVRGQLTNEAEQVLESALLEVARNEK